MTQLINEIKRLNQAWPDADMQLARALTSIGTSMSGPGTLRDVAFQIAQHIPDLQRRLDLIVATQKIGLDKGVVWADETLWVSNSPASGAAAAKSVADQLRQAQKDAAFVGGEEALGRKLLELLEKHQNDPYFAVAFAKEMPPKELKALLKDLYLSQNGSLHNDPPSPDIDRLVAALGVTLGTASRGAGDMKLPKGYVDELITSDEPVSGTIVGNLLRHGTFDDAFLRGIANKVFDNAKKPRAERQDIIGFNSGIAAALTNNTRVAQDFFTDPARKPLALLMRETHWDDGGQEMGRAIEAATRTFRDHGQPPGTSRGYKSALIASWAVHFWADRRTQSALPHTRQSAGRVFAAYMSDVHRISSSGTAEQMGVTPLPDTDQNLPGRQAYGALFNRDEAKNAMTWAFKDPQALKTVIEAHGEYSVRVLDALGNEIKDQVDTAFTEWHKSHPNATEAEQSAYRQKLLSDGMAGAPGKLFNAKAGTLSKSLHLIVDAGNLTQINEADRQDQAHKAFKEGVERTLKLALTPTGDWVVAGYEFIAENAGDHIKFTEGDKARNKAEATLVESQNLFKDLIASSMMRHGLFGDESAPGSAHPHSDPNYAKKSKGDFLANGQIIPRSQMTSEQAYAYDEWLTHSKASGVFDETGQAVWNGFQLPAPPYPEPKE
ncbi:hypothetical protein ACWCOT_24585 [Nonomuraea bangladeshensis]